VRDVVVEGDRQFGVFAGLDRRERARCRLPAHPETEVPRVVERPAGLRGELFRGRLQIARKLGGCEHAAQLEHIARLRHLALHAQLPHFGIGRRRAVFVIHRDLLRIARREHLHKVLNARAVDTELFTLESSAERCGVTPQRPVGRDDRLGAERD
jgi:hypothetical protein